MLLRALYCTIALFIFIYIQACVCHIALTLTNQSGHLYNVSLPHPVLCTEVCSIFMRLHGNAALVHCITLSFSCVVVCGSTTLGHPHCQNTCDSELEKS